MTPVSVAETSSSRHELVTSTETWIPDSKKALDVESSSSTTLTPVTSSTESHVELTSEPPKLEEGADQEKPKTHEDIPKLPSDETEDDDASTGVKTEDVHSSSTPKETDESDQQHPTPDSLSSSPSSSSTESSSLATEGERREKKEVKERER